MMMKERSKCHKTPPCGPLGGGGYAVTWRVTLGAHTHAEQRWEAHKAAKEVQNQVPHGELAFIQA